MAKDVYYPSTRAGSVPSQGPVVTLPVQTDSWRRYRVLVNSVQEAVLTVDREGVIQSVNQVAVTLFGRHCSHLLGAHITDFLDAEEPALGVLHDVPTLARDELLAAVSIRSSVNEPKDGLVWAVALDRPPSDSFLVIIRDETEQSDLRASLDYATSRDPLTGLLNRWSIDAVLHKKLVHEGNHTGELVVLRLDIDHFQAINDLFGHTNGDVVLSIIANRLRGIFGEECAVGRLDGDEFLLIVPLEEYQSADDVAAAVLECVGKSLAFDDHAIDVSVSIGVAVAPQHGVSTDEILRASDLALAQAKFYGRSQYRIYQSDLGEQHQYELAIERDLEEAIGTEEMLLYYQPIIDLVTGRPVGAEALVRWQHPERGLVSAGTFIPVAERNGLMPELGHWILSAVLEDLEGWQGRPDDFYIAVNVSSQHFRSRKFINQLDTILANHDARGENIVLEITEKIILDDAEYAANILCLLRDRDIRVAIDDFGTGYSSLRYLRTLPVDILKVDGSFLGGVPDDPDAVAIVDAVLSLGEAMAIAVVAEGVETSTQEQFLRARGCSHAQGFYFGQPGSLDLLAEGDHES